MRFWIGIDDTDSRKGMCTTYIASLVIKELEKAGMKTIGFPRLVRLNPTIPYKTRGNGAVSILVDGEIGEAVEIVREIVEEYAELDDENTHPGVVFVREDLVDKLQNFSFKALRDVVSLDEALFIIGKYLIPHLKYKKGRGLIGALASVGLPLEDRTLELLVYRKRERFGKEREIVEESFFLADLMTYPYTWDTVDWGNNVVVAAPNSPDPVLFGIRGDNLEKIFEAFRYIEAEDYDFYQIFITNQGTDMHIIDEGDVRELKEFRSYRLTGKVIEFPWEIEGGHVFFKIETTFGEVECAAFEPTKQFRRVVRKLMPGDVVEVYGSYKNATLNLEKIRIVKVARVFFEENPICECGRRMESAGKGKGFRCKRCKKVVNYRILKEVRRDVEEGFYEVPPSARRHLSKPLVREGFKENFHIFR